MKKLISAAALAVSAVPAATAGLDDLTESSQVIMVNTNENDPDFGACMYFGFDPTLGSSGQWAQYSWSGAGDPGMLANTFAGEEDCYERSEWLNQQEGWDNWEDC